MRPKIDDKKCYVDPRMCIVIKACPQEAICYIENDDLPLGGKIVFDYDKCDGCGICADICCGQAVDML